MTAIDNSVQNPIPNDSIAQTTVCAMITEIPLRKDFRAAERHTMTCLLQHVYAIPTLVFGRIVGSR